ncbi:hypothetical protein E1A91_A12G027400v1 [Gossypium mustelinum]|uniref:COBRA-like protein n=1 Tax=Gossypium mustelinum TaxID=34275 RepID=A0A5D2WPC6_GOSMU|nr:hypothetical protein E1A91_A12G027400v1 [Gossypium mustelinum]
MDPFYFVFGRSANMVLILIFFFCSVSPSYGYDPLDPKGNITIKWDLLQSNSDTNDVKVSLLNFQLYRHIELPGWKLGWEWLGKEVIWSIQEAEATEQGNCFRFKGGQLPHCCEKKPLIVDLLPRAPYNIQTSNCCKGGVLSSMIQDPTKYAAVFQMNIGAGGVVDSDFDMPQNFSLGVPGYTCAKPVRVAPSKYSSDGGRRWTQALGTWNVTCIYSQYQASTSPKCSSTYNDSIVHCPKCSCSCQGLSGSKCVKFGETPSLLQQVKDSNQEPPSIVRCTRHMCPIRPLALKITVNNLNILKNYSGWNLVALHPNLKSLTQVFSFNYHPLNQYGHINDSGMFWGVEYYNDMLLQEGEVGNVQSEMLLHKDEGIFSFREGWVFPRRILFNGDECVMPPPDDYPRLPKNTARAASFTLSIIFSSLFMLLIIFAC